MKYKTLILTLAIFTGCSDKFERVPEDRFIGTWELIGRSMFDGIKVEINQNEKGKLVGRIKDLNDNKFVKMFAEVGDVWISDVSRSSNFQFRITEKKIGRELFSLYGLSSSAEFKAEFIDENTIGISGNADPSKSSVTYKRTEETQANNVYNP
ncbi:MAG: hypothetical protein COA57_07580 [Flavobacteriales bacterium]|nr:MAG: hypothetical protein COA57_07580 [Flavobacteriales bacterium]